MPGASNAVGLSSKVNRLEHLAKSRENETGSALVEFAASAILLFTLLFGILECSQAVYVYHFTASAAQDAGHYAMTRGASWSANCTSFTSSSCIASSSDVSSFVNSLASAGVNTASLSAETSWPGVDATGASCAPSNAAGCLVLVKVRYSFSFVSPLLPRKVLFLASTSEVTIVQ